MSNTIRTQKNSYFYEKIDNISINYNYFKIIETADFQNVTWNYI